MKRVIFATIIVLIVAGIVGAVSAQVTCPTTSPDTVTNLVAGQFITIGTVSVWNAGENINVVYKITAPGWYLTETHLDVRCTAAEIPQTLKTKTGGPNPIPGHFAYRESFAVTDHQTEWCTQIPKPDCGCKYLTYVAAHAAVVHLTETCSDVASGTAVTTITQRRSGDAAAFTSVNLPAVDAWEPGPAYPNDGPIDSGWEANSLWDQQIFGKGIDTTVADWIWESYQVQDPVVGTVLTMTTPLFNGYPVSGDLYITCDNGYEAFVNGQSVGSANVFGDWKFSNLKQAFVDTNGWQSVQHYDLTPNLVSGQNVLTIDAANEYLNPDDLPNNMIGTLSNNPGACIFQAPVCYENIDQMETAWGAGSRFNTKGNWGMYFTFPTCVD
jgi:hypothetical protein